MKMCPEAYATEPRSSSLQLRLSACRTNTYQVACCTPEHAARNAKAEESNKMARMQSFFTVDPKNWRFTTHGDVQNGLRRAQEYFSRNGSYQGAENHIEEFVRQWALQCLVDDYKYPEDWMGGRIIIEEPVKMGSSSKEADISIKNSTGRTYLYVELKNKGVSEEEFGEAERQLETYLSSTHTATIGMVSDGLRTKIVRKKIDPNDFEYVSDIPSFGMEARAQTKLVRSIPTSGDQKTTGLKTIGSDYEKILFEAHSAVRDVDGLHADEALDELCKVLYAKIYDERTTAKDAAGTAFRFQAYGAANASEVASEIRVLYEEARRSDLELYSKRIPGYERSRGVFKHQIRLSDIALFQVVEALQDYSIVDSGSDVKGAAFQRVLGPAIRAGMGQYFTPDPIVDLAVQIIQPTASETIIDPFCGSGHFLTKCLSYVVKNQGASISDRDLNEFKFFHLHGIEKSDRMVRIAMTDMLLHDDGHTNIRNIDALLSFDNYPDLVALREDDNTDPAIFDVVVTNPPFGSTIKKEALSMLGRFELAQGRKSLPLEVLGLERSIQLLRPNGRMAIVLPEHLLKGKSNRYVRQWLFSSCEMKAMISFPEEAFTPYGAMVKTCLCILRKLEEDEELPDDGPAFLCEVENLGYDATGREKAGSEISAVAQDFHNQVGWA